MRTPCRFYNTPRGCNKGDSCTFLHEGADSSGHGPPTGTRGRAGRAPGSRGTTSSFNHGRGSASHDGLFAQLLQDLAYNIDLTLPAATVQRWVQLALQRCQRGDAQQVLRSLMREDGSNMLRAAALQLDLPQAGLVGSQLLGVVMPLLKLLTQDCIRSDPAQFNPVLATLHGSLRMDALATALQELSQHEAAGAPEFIRQQLSRTGGMVMPCLPSDWLDVLQFITIYLQEVAQRFTSTFQQQPDTLAAAQALLNAATAALHKHLSPGSATARSRAPDWRRLVARVALLERQLNAQQDAGRKIEQLQAMIAQYEAQQRQNSGAVSASAATGGPGELRSGGSRHDNDKISHLDIAVAPTRDEVLCNKQPFLPHNRPGSLPHAAHDPDRAHRELHFRLLRHDVIGPVTDAAQAFFQFGGVAGLKKLKNQTKGTSVRLQLKAGRDFQDLYVFRNVSILGLTNTSNGGVAYRIEFDDAPQLANATTARRRDWWAHTKQLQHGSLAALWWDGNSDSADGTALPNIMFATVCERDEKLLAAGGEPRKRPQLGLRMCGEAITSELMAAVLGRQRLGGKKEVVLLPAAGSFFAYEPILKALQATHPLPLARYILHGSAAAKPSLALVRGEVVGGRFGAAAEMENVQVPAYAAGADCCYDFTAVLSQDKLKDLSMEDINRLCKVNISSAEGVHLDLLLKATSLDASQAAALAACLTKELAVVQGPPGCGKTYIGVQLVRLLLANTRTGNSSAAADLQCLQSSIAPSVRPVIGPVLVLCYTNHALDSFLLDLVECGIDEGIVRVGRRSTCVELERYNLRNQDGAQARGADVGRCRARVENLKDMVNQKLDQLKTSRTVRRLRWDDVQQWLERQHPALLEAFTWRAAVMEQAAFLQEATAAVDNEGFTRAKSSRRRRQQLSSNTAAAEWVWGSDAMQDWLHSSPAQDWRREQWMEQSVQRWEQEAYKGLSASATAASTAETADDSSHNSSNPNRTTQHADDTYDGGIYAGVGGSSGVNPFAALAGLDDGDEFSNMLDTAALSADAAASSNIAPQGSSLPAAGANASAGASSGSAGAGFGEWLMLDNLEHTCVVAAVGTESAVQNMPAEAADDAWQLADLSEHSEDEHKPSTEAASLAAESGNQPQQQDTGSIERGHQPVAARQETDDQTIHEGTWYDAADDSETSTASATAQPAVPDEVLQFEQLNRPIEELLLMDDISAMSRPEREKLYQHWLNALAAQWGTDINDLLQELEEKQKELKQLYDRASLQVLREARIVGMTTTGLANQQGLLHALQPKVVIVEEAAEVLEAHIITSLSPSVEHLILIGDHLQLPPKVEVYELQKESGRGYNLNVSMFERLVEAGTVQHVTLQEQRRMRPEISDLIRGPLYPQLLDHPAVKTYPHVKGMTKDVFFWDHNNKEGGTDQSKSRFNEYEVDACVGLARYLLQQGYGGSEKPDICILTPYVGQLLKLRKAVAALSDLKFVMSERDEADLAHVVTDASTADGNFDSTVFGSRDDSQSEPTTGAVRAADVSLVGSGSKVVTLGRSLRLATIDNFQGEEARIIILSLVRNPREDGAGIGFLAVNNRINVLLSRAKEGMYLVGSSRALYAAAEKAAAAGRPCMWSAVLDHLDANAALGPSLQACCQRHKQVTDINHPRDFQALVGDGGCQKDCGLKLPCGHICSRRCHADDPQHIQTKCLKPCGKLCARERHPCERLCYEPCTTCTALEDEVQLPCGHIARNIPCHRAAKPELIPCKELVQVTIPGCGHVLTVACSKQAAFLAGTAPCTQLVHLAMPACKHSLTLPCGKAAVALLDPTVCTSTCGGLLPGCEHICSGICGKCMQLRLEITGASNNQPAGAEATSTQPGLLEMFIEQLQRNHPQLFRLWDDWSNDPAGGRAAAVRSERLSSRWQRFVKGKIAPALGTAQCSSKGVVLSASRSSAAENSPDGELQWEQYIRRIRQLGSNANAEERLAVEWQAWLLHAACNSTGGNLAGSSLSALQVRHVACKKPCLKPLACGHECQSTCHQGSSCGPCKQPCSISCEHAHCERPCAAPCAPCAEPCGWYCEHKGPCLLPCGVPCDREPCNLRCSKLLECGHRCPGLCGETCLPKKFCVDPACKKRATPDVANRVVDMLLFKTFGELSDTDVSRDPLILLPCGHLFTTSTLDGHMAIAEAYAHSTASSNATDNSSSYLELWGAPLNRSDFPAPKSCPDCRRVICGVRRYGRVVLHSQLGVTQRKYAEAIRSQLKNSFSELSRLQAQLVSPDVPWRDNITAAAVQRLIKKKKPLAAGILPDLDKGDRAAGGLGLGFQRLAAAAQHTPKRHVAETHKAALLSAFHAGRLDPNAGLERWAAVEKAISSKPDMQMTFEAVQGYAGAVRVCLTYITRQFEALATGLDTIAYAFDDLSGMEHLLARVGSGSTSQERRWTGQTRWLTDQRRDLQGQVHRLTAHAYSIFEGAVQCVSWAIKASADDSCYTASYRLSHCMMLLLIERANQLQPLKQGTLARLLAHTATSEPGGVLDRAAALGAYHHGLQQMQEQLLHQAEQAGTAALGLFAVQKQRLLADAGDNIEQQQEVLGRRNTAVEAVQALLARLPQIRSDFAGELNAAEVAAVLGALMQAEGMYYSDMGIDSFMAGHLYECPNGHLFVIGECGGAMQASRCDRCGARIGGAHHQLDASNRRVSRATAEAVAAAARSRNA